VSSTLLLSASLVAGSATVIGSSHPDPLAQAVEALGGADALDGLDRFQITSNGAIFVDYEATEPDGSMDGSTFAKTYTFDVPAGQLRVDTERQLLFEAFQFMEPQIFSIVLDGDVGGMTGEAGTFFPSPPTLPSLGVASLRKQQMLFNPQLILRAALADPASAGDGGPADYDGRSHRILTIADDIAEIRLFIDEETGLISKLETM
jgi:hypothetical protein